MTCLQYCLMEPKRDSHSWGSLRQPSLVLCWAESFLDAADTLGSLWFTSPQRREGTGLSRGDFPSPPPNRFSAVCLKLLVLGREQDAICSEVCFSKVLGAMTLSDGAHEPANASWKMETNFMWLCLVGCWEKGGRWNLGRLFQTSCQEEGKLLWLSGRAPPLLSFCSYGLAFRTGSNTSYQLVLVSLARNILTYFFFLSFFFFPPREVLTSHHHAPGTSRAKAHWWQIRHQTGDPFSISVGWFGFRLRVRKSCWNDYCFIVCHVVWTEADLACRSHCKDKQEAQEKWFSVVTGAGDTAKTEGELSWQAGSCSAALVSPG